MFAIWKFRVPIEGEFVIDMPLGAKLLKFDLTPRAIAAGSDLCLWAVVRVSAPRVPRRFRLVGTGEPDDRYIAFAPYVGTAVLPGGHLVLHLFDCGEDPTPASAPTQPTPST